VSAVLEASAPSLDELKLRASTCASCALSERRTNVVFGEGNPRAALVLVGEGPGETEDLTGRPFVGRAGQLLDQALEENGLSRDIVYICNVVKCRACDWSTGRPVNRAPLEHETEACRRWLEPQLWSISPYVILCVGAPSAKSLIKRDFKITTERGRYFPCAYARCAIATLHPAYILRQQSSVSDGGYGLLVSDIGKAWEAAQRLRLMDSQGRLKPWVIAGPSEPGMAGAETAESRSEAAQSSLFD
jgi:DNA polymerase